MPDPTLLGRFDGDLVIEREPRDWRDLAQDLGDLGLGRFVLHGTRDDQRLVFQLDLEALGDVGGFAFQSALDVILERLPCFRGHFLAFVDRGSSRISRFIQGFLALVGGRADGVFRALFGALGIASEDADRREYAQRKQGESDFLHVFLLSASQGSTRMDVLRHQRQLFFSPQSSHWFLKRLAIQCPVFSIFLKFALRMVQSRVYYLVLMSLHRACRFLVSTLLAAIILPCHASWDNFSYPNSFTDYPEAVGPIDSNGDGHHGMKYGPIYVSPSGDDGNPGTMALPMRTLNAAILAARILFRPVYVMEGTYVEGLILSNAVLVGSMTSTWGAGTSITTVVASPYSLGAFNSTNNTGFNPFAADFCQSVKIVASAATIPGHSSVALETSMYLGTMTLTNSILIAGPGAPGATGSHGTPGEDGQPGTAGATGASGGLGGPGGAGFFGVLGGDGGIGANGQFVPPLAGDPGLGIGGGLGGDPGSSSTNSANVRSGGDGGDGAPGTNGINGVASAGAFFGNAVPATAGTEGGGGGGGGGGGAFSTFKGGGGGGGGAGGGPSLPGGSGGRGGHSFAIFCKEVDTTFSKEITLDNTTLTAQNAGTGGSGGNGAVGGLGAPGGNGGVGSSLSKPGGKGGAGANAGNSGSGAGGAGGSSFGIYIGGNVSLSGGSITHGIAGLGGAGGSGPFGNAPSGISGQSGNTHFATLSSTGSLTTNMPSILAVHGRNVFSRNTGRKTVQCQFATYPFTPNVSLVSVSPGAHGTTSVSGSKVHYDYSGGGPEGIEVLDVVGRNDDTNETVNGKVLFSFRRGMGFRVVQQGHSFFGDPFLPITASFYDEDGVLVEEQSFTALSSIASILGPSTDTVKTVRFKTPKGLSQERPYQIGPLIEFSLLSGDCDDNDAVTTDDYLIISAAFDTAFGDPGYDFRADLEEDDFVNTDDYLLLSQNFDLSGPTG